MLTKRLKKKKKEKIEKGGGNEEASKQNCDEPSQQLSTSGTQNVHANDQSNPLQNTSDVSFSDSFIERTAQDWEADPKTFDEFLKFLQN